jgi:glycosyltransferase involved in cell wall biosynthesis
MNSDSPLVSIIVPVYNCAEWVGFTVDSVLNQTYTNWELLLINDGSTDQTPAVLEELATKDSRIRVIHQTNGKQGKARNNGIRSSKGSWIAFLDADDIWPPNKLNDQLKISFDQSVDLTFTDGFICIGNQMDLRTFRFGVLDRVFKGPMAVQEFHAQNLIPTSSVMVKKTVLDSYGAFPEELEIQNCEDYLLWTRLLNQGAIFLGISEPLLYYRVHDQSSTSQEVKALTPLIRALWIIEGEKLEARKAHLEVVFKKLIALLSESKELQKLEPLISNSLRILRPGIKGVLIGFAFKFSPRLFVSLIWRSSPIKN